MDLERSPSSIGSGGAGSSSAYKRRDRVAAQACETCRGRKQRCDEIRPKCSLCQRLGLDCRYREPVPTKKDNTLLEILHKLGNVERKIDQISGTTDSAKVWRPAKLAEHDTSALRTITATPAFLSHDSLKLHASANPRTPTESHVYTPSTQVMLAWPVIQQLFIQQHHGHVASKGKGLQAEISPHHSTILASGIDEAKEALDAEKDTPSAFSTGAPAPTPYSYTSPHGIQSTVMSMISWETVQTLSKAYFDTFNLLHPIVDEQWFLNHAVGHILNTVDSTPASALAFLVLALGETALDDRSVSMSQVSGVTAGVKGGATEQPAGLGFFNEARKRLGLFLTEVSIENLQVLSLTALYYASCGRASDCWRMAASATLICQTLASQASEAASSHDLIRRLVWYCSSIAFYLRAEFHLYMASMEQISSDPGLRYIAGTQEVEDVSLARSPPFQDYNHAQTVMSGLLSTLYNDLENLQVSAGTPVASPMQTLSGIQTIRDAVEYHGSQLNTWRGLLPPGLAWQDGQLLESNYSPQPPVALVGTLQAALLRSQYYHARYLIYRPYVHRVLHHSASLASEDMAGAAESLQASLKWPVTMAPANTSKRLIPIPFYWSQNICGVLVLLHLTQQHPALSHIRHNFCGRHFELEASETVELYIQWLRDMRQIDATAERCWGIVRPLYGLEA